MPWNIEPPMAPIAKPAPESFQIRFGHGSRSIVANQYTILDSHTHSIDKHQHQQQDQQEQQEKERRREGRKEQPRDQ